MVLPADEFCIASYHCIISEITARLYTPKVTFAVQLCWENRFKIPQLHYENPLSACPLQMLLSVRIVDETASIWNLTRPGKFLVFASENLVLVTRATETFSSEWKTIEFFKNGGNIPPSIFYHRFWTYVPERDGQTEAQKDGQTAPLHNAAAVNRQCRIGLIARHRFENSADQCDFDLRGDISSKLEVRVSVLDLRARQMKSGQDAGRTGGPFYTVLIIGADCTSAAAPIWWWICNGVC